MIILRPSLPRKCLGWACIVLGALGLVLPFLQGFLFLAVGIFVLRDQYVWAAERWAWVRARWPRQVTTVEAMETRLRHGLAGPRDWARRLFGRDWQA